MARDVPVAVTTATESDNIKMFWAVDLLFDSPNDLYFWTGHSSLSYGGNTYTNAGELLTVSDIRESSDIAAYGATLTISGIPSNLISLAQSEPYQGRQCLVKFGVQIPLGYLQKEDTDYILTEGSEEIILEHTEDIVMFTVFEGEMDQMNFKVGPETATISLAVESRLVDLRKPRIRRYSDGDHQVRYPGDRAFEFIPRLQNESLEWA